MAGYWEKAAHSAYNMFSKYKYLIVNLVFSYLGFWSGNIFLIAPFPDHCLLVPFPTFVSLPPWSFRGRQDKATAMIFVSLHIFILFHVYHLSLPMGKPTICIGENKDADQLRGNREADQRLCFRYSDSTIPLLLKSEFSSF